MSSSIISYCKFCCQMKILTIPSFLQSCFGISSFVNIENLKKGAWLDPFVLQKALVREPYKPMDMEEE